VGKSRARNPTRNPTQKPTSNRPEPGRTTQRLRTAPCPQVLRSVRDAWRAHGSNKSENQKEKTNSTLNSQPHPRHSTPKGKLHASHPTPSLQSPPATRGGMAHEEQNDPVAQSSMYQRRPPNLVASTADLSERDIKENPVVKEEEN